MKEMIPRYSKSPIKAVGEQRLSSPTFKLPNFKLKNSVNTSPCFVQNFEEIEEISTPVTKRRNWLTTSKSVATFNRTVANKAIKDLSLSLVASKKLAVKRKNSKKR